MAHSTISLMNTTASSVNADAPTPRRLIPKNNTSTPTDATPRDDVGGTQDVREVVPERECVHGKRDDVAEDQQPCGEPSEFRGAAILQVHERAARSPRP